MSEGLKIYECQAIITEIEALAAQNEGELTDEQLQKLVEAQTTSLVKVGNLCGFMKYLEHGITNCKAEEERIAKMRKVAANRLANIKQFLLPFMLERKKLTIGTFQLSTRKSTLVVLEDDFLDVEENPFCNAKTVVTPDKIKIKDALKSGEEILGASLETKVSVQLK